MTITPSKITPWEGTAVHGERFTAQQLQVLKGERPRQGEHVVRLTYPSVLQWGAPTIKHVPCPILAFTRDGTRRLIVTPAGEKMWVAASSDRGGYDGE